MCRPRIVPVTILPCLLWVAPIGKLRADDLPSKVTGQGLYEIRKQPDALHVQVEVLAKARSAKEAVAKLQEHRQAARSKLEAMGAAPSSIEFSEPMVTVGQDPNEARMQMMMQRQAMMQGGKKPPAKAKEPPPVVVACVLRAEIPLTAKGPEELLIFSHDLEERIKQADLGAVKDLKQNSPQEEENAAEQMQMMGGMMNDPEQNARGLPSFSYAKKLTTEERAQTVREAFKRAEKQAAELAAAAGLTLGSVLSLDEMPGISNDETPNYMEMQYARMGIARPPVFPNENKRILEATGPKPSQVTYRVGVNAAFELKRLKPR